MFIKNYELHGLKLEFIQAIISQTTTIIGDQPSFMAWASSNQHLKFPIAEIPNLRKLIFFPPNFLRRGFSLGFDLCLLGINKHKILKLQKVCNF